jgi:hypothetical protein
LANNTYKTEEQLKFLLRNLKNNGKFLLKSRTPLKKSNFIAIYFGGFSTIFRLN